MSARLLLLGLALALAACHGAPYVVVHVDATGPLPGLAQLHVDVAATARTASFDVPGAGMRALPQRFSIELPSGTRGTVQITVTALDGEGAQMASGDGSVEMTGDHAVDLDVLLDAGSGADLGTPDLLDASDGSAPADLASYDAGPVYCPSGAIFCDDFETGNASRWSPPTVLAPATGAVNTTQPHRGSYALATHMPVNATPAFDYLEKTFSTSAPVVSARAYVFAPSAPGNYSSMLALIPTGGYLSLATDQNNKLAVTEKSGPDHISGTSMPLNKWVCLELLVDLSGGGNGHVRLYADQVLQIDFVPALPPVPLSALRVGLVRAAGNVAADVFVDDVALATSYIGCP
jgi:hypothetical protein